LARMLELLADAAPGRPVVDTLAQDDLVGSLLLLYGLHPYDLATRVRQALDQVRPQLHGGNVELLELATSGLRLRIHGSGHGCHSSPDALRQVVEEAILAKAPDVPGLQIDIAAAEHAAAPAAFIPLTELHVKNGTASASHKEGATH